ncbi:alpha/beta hydrolase [Lederbergia sp. NSJ-179]|uniref:alpha/beta fold hydrolase n=1 Tax=Lederbergia sp. NSJ-179 TaxID=2931402 RepID=UPI001FCFDA24|nr:alpha/beta hydrolase [Lederbergia sp. NSJ-179]MCJ7843429.1 alpha/beta hydrolase [Lederbergia sp. NSJ-179]
MAATVSKHVYQINNIDLYYESYIHNHERPVDTIILIHGFLSSTFSFRKLAPLLANDFNVLAIDFPPFGKSGRSPSFHYSYRNIAHTIWLLLDHLNCSSCYGIGHSMGGQIIFNMMHQRPNHIKKGVFLCSSAYLSRIKPPYTYLSYLPFFEKIIRHKLGKTGVLGNLHNVVYDKSIIDKEMILGYTEPFEDDKMFCAFKKMIRHWEGDLPSEILHTISTPCLLIWGENDQIVPNRIGKRLAQDLPNAQFISLPKTGHLIPEERPWEAYCDIREFFFQDR